MKTKGYGKIERRKLVSKEIKYCVGKGVKHKKCVRFKYIAWTAIVIFILATDKFTDLLRLL